jgi:hypothetical protein
MAIRYLSGINVDSNTLFVDSTNNRVGIGTASPASPLQVSAASVLSQGTLSIVNTYASGGVYFPTARFIQQRGDHSFGIVSEFYTGATNGTDRPSILFNTGNSSNSWQVGMATSGWAGNDSFGIGYRASNDPASFNTWPTARFLITTGGNVLINTTTDNGSTLRVNGTIYADSTITSATSVRAVEGYFNPYTSAGNNAVPVYQDAIFLGPVDNDCTIQFGNEFFSAHGSYIRFRTNSASAPNTPVNVMTMFPNGKVALNQYGAGTFTGTAAYNLAVDSSGNIIETAGAVVDGSGTTNYVSKWTDSNTIGNSQIFDNGTNVGIGTTSPNEKLHVAGNVHAYAAGGIDAGLFASTSAGSTTIAIRSSGITHFNGGNVLIGTTTDSGEKLVVNGTIGIPFTSTIRVAGGGYTRNDIISTGYNNVSDLKDFLILEAPGSSNGKIILGTGSYVSVGIGTNAPSSGLVVATYGFKWDSDVQYNQPAGNIFSNLGFCFADQENWIGLRGSYGSSTGSANLLLQANFRDVGSNAGHYVASQAISLGNADFVIGRLQTQVSASTAPAKVEQLRIFQSGKLKLNLYGSGTFTGTPTYNLGVDSSGNVIELPGGVVDGSGTANYVTKWSDANTITDSQIRDDGTTVGIGTAPAAAKLTVNGPVNIGGRYLYNNFQGSLDTTGVNVAGLSTSTNGDSAFFTFEAGAGDGQYQRIVYSCYNAGGTWNVVKVIDEGTNRFDVVASASSGSTITFTWKSRSGIIYYTPRLIVTGVGSINTSYL